MEKLMRFLKNEDGATAIEYCLIASLIAAAVVGGATLLSTNTQNIYDNTANQLGAALAP